MGIYFNHGRPKPIRQTNEPHLHTPLIPSIPLRAQNDLGGARQARRLTANLAARPTRPRKSEEIARGAATLEGATEVLSERCSTLNWEYLQEYLLNPPRNSQDNLAFWYLQ